MIQLCKDCQERLFDEWAKIIAQGCTDFWPDEFLLGWEDSITIRKSDFLAGMAKRGWYCCTSCYLWQREPLNEEELCAECAAQTPQEEPWEL